MVERLSLQASTRKKIGKAVKEVRRAGFIPAVLYGYGISKTQSLSVPERETDVVVREAGENSLIDLSVDKKKPVQVLIKDTAHEPTNGKFIHLDFYKVNLKKKITAQVPLEFIGKSKAVVDSGGTLVKTISEVEVGCLPLNLPHNLEVDISTLATFDDLVYIKDIKLPKNVTLLADGDEVVATVQAPRSEAELEALDEEVSEDVEAVEGVKEEEEESAEADSTSKIEEPAPEEKPEENEN